MISGLIRNKIMNKNILLGLMCFLLGGCTTSIVDDRQCDKKIDSTITILRNDIHDSVMARSPKVCYNSLDTVIYSYDTVIYRDTIYQPQFVGNGNVIIRGEIIPVGETLGIQMNDSVVFKLWIDGCKVEVNGK